MVENIKYNYIINWLFEFRTSEEKRNFKKFLRIIGCKKFQFINILDKNYKVIYIIGNCLILEIGECNKRVLSDIQKQFSNTNSKYIEVIKY